MKPNRLRLDTVSAIAEIVAAAGVVLSLLYVGSEVRRNTNASQAATYQEVVRASNEYLLALAQDSTLADIVVRGEDDPASLTAVEGRRYFSYVRVLWRNMDNAFVQHKRGVLADSEWEIYHGIACRSRRTTPEWLWDLHRGALSPDLVALLDEC